MKTDGFFIIFRELFNDPLWLNGSPTMKLLMIYLMGKVNHEPNMWMWEGEKFEVQRGQTITSLEKLQREIGKGVSIQNIRTALNNLEKYGFLTNQSTKSGRLITIVNYDELQGIDNKTNKDTNKDLTKTSQRPNKDLTTNNNNNNINNDKNDKKIHTALNDKNHSTLKKKINFNFDTNKWENITKEDIEIWSSAYPACDINMGLNQMRAWLIANPDKRKTNYRRFITNWFARWQDSGGVKKNIKGDTNAKSKHFENEREYTDEEQRRISAKFFGEEL
ncbi:MAG: hypothetical protein WDA59_11075 [Methanofastidiosum sp.]|jgi:hypothetical protein